MGLGGIGVSELIGGLSRAVSDLACIVCRLLVGALGTLLLLALLLIFGGLDRVLRRRLLGRRLTLGARVWLALFTGLAGWVGGLGLARLWCLAGRLRRRGGRLGVGTGFRRRSLVWAGLGRAGLG